MDQLKNTNKEEEDDTLFIQLYEMNRSEIKTAIKDCHIVKQAVFNCSKKKSNHDKAMCYEKYYDKIMNCVRLSALLEKRLN